MKGPRVLWRGPFTLFLGNALYLAVASIVV